MKASLPESFDYGSWDAQVEEESNISEITRHGCGEDTEKNQLEREDCMQYLQLTAPPNGPTR